MEPLGKDLDKFTEVDTLVGNVVEDSLELIALILHIANLHIQTHIGGNLSRCDHRLVLEGYGLLPALDVVGAGLAVNLLKLAIVGVEAHATHLLSHHIARKRDDADVVTRLCLYGYDIASFEVEVVDILVVGATRILESHLEYIGRYVVGILLEPVGFVELVAILHGYGIHLVATVAEAASSPNFGHMFFIATHYRIIRLSIYIYKTG